MTRRHWMLAGLVTLALSTWAFTRAQPDAAVHQSASAPVDFVAAPGRVEAVSEDVDLGFEIPGRIDAVLVDEGDRVIAGQVLARLDDSVQRAARASADARLAMARAELDRVVNGARTEERREADAARAQGYRDYSLTTLGTLASAPWVADSGRGVLRRQAYNIPADRREGTYAWGDAYLLRALAAAAALTG